MWRPDISFAIGRLCQKSAAPTEGDWKAAIHLLKYLYGTRTEGTAIQGTGSAIIYSDAGDDIQGKATTGILTTMEGGTLLSWAFCKQDIVTLSMTEAEYVAAAAGA